jgi:hypothetical protein
MKCRGYVSCTLKLVTRLAAPIYISFYSSVNLSHIRMVSGWNVSRGICYSYRSIRVFLRLFSEMPASRNLKDRERLLLSVILHTLPLRSFYYT